MNPRRLLFAALLSPMLLEAQSGSTTYSYNGPGGDHVHGVAPGAQGNKVRATLAMAQAHTPMAKAAPGVASTPVKEANGRWHRTFPPTPPAHRAFPMTHGTPPPTANGNRGGAPPNDEACDAPVDALAIGGSVDWSGSLGGATDSEGFGAPTVWQAFTIAECADVTLDWCGTAPPYPYDWDVLMDGPCDAMVNYYFPGYPSECADGNLIVTYYTLPPGTYYVLIADADGSAGDYSIHASANACPPPPPNDEVCDVTPAPLGLGETATWSGIMAGATDLEGMGMNTVWEAFTLNECADVTFNWCGSSTDEMSSFFGLIMGDCDDPDNWNQALVSMQLTDCGDGNLLSTAYGLQPGTYYVMIYAGPADAYTLQVSAIACAPPPANDHCGDVQAEVLAIGSTLTFTGQVTSSTPDGDFDPSFSGDQSVGTVWHSFTTTECANITVTYCGMDNPYASNWVFLSTSCPADWTVILGSWDREQCANQGTTIQYWELPAGTYYLPVGNFGDAWPYMVEVHASACGPYCAAWALSTIPFYEKISQVSFAGIERSSTLGIGYEPFLEDTAHIVRGASYPLAVSLSNGYYGDQVLAWIDFNRDTVFQADELVLSTPLGEGPFTGDVTIPMDAAIGNTRMRLRMHDAGHPDWANDEPCGMASYGQVEDYTVLIDIGSGIQESTPDRFAVMPNPVTDQLAIAFAPESRPIQLVVRDATGRMVHVRALSGVAGPISLDMGSMERGLYLVHVDFADGSEAVQRVVKK